MTSAFVTNELVTYDIAGQYWLDDLANGEDGESTENKGALGVGTYHEHARNRVESIGGGYFIERCYKIGTEQVEVGIDSPIRKDTRPSEGMGDARFGGLFFAAYGAIGRDDL